MRTGWSELPPTTPQDFNCHDAKDNSSCDGHPLRANATEFIGKPTTGCPKTALG
jgi:hypothetical protein